VLGTGVAAGSSRSNGAVLGTLQAVKRMGHTDPTQVITIRLELPASVPLSEQEAREILVLKLVEEGYLSQSEGARLLGVSRAELIERMTQAKMAVARYTPEDLVRETETLHWLQQQRAMSNRVLYQSRSQSSQKRVCPITPSLRFPLQAGGTEPTRPTRFPSRSGGNLKEQGY
jgi:predicted HTH domain antitoxin